MECPACRHENQQGSKFCASCGSPLSKPCPKCLHVNPVHSNYCTVCGQTLEDNPAKAAGAHEAVRGVAIHGERRQATILFADVSGYTALTERLDPEEVEDIINEIKSTAETTITKHGGMVNQFFGDEVLALFGIPNAAEDDPIRAIKAALELHADIREKAGELQTRTGERLAIHTGINTGLILAQYQNDREGIYRLTGDAVNTGARLRALAEADEILIGPNTHRLIRPYFEVVPRPPAQMRGKSATVVPYRVIGETRIRSRFDAARQRGFKTYVGRTSEAQTLRTCLAQALDGKPQFVTIEGDPGIGKSRLLFEFMSSLDLEAVTVPQGRCQSYGSETPYYPFLVGLRRGLHIYEGHSHGEALQRAVGAIREIDPSLERYLPLYLHLLSIPSEHVLPEHLGGEALRKAMEEALTAITVASTGLRPMVAIFEDWHWSDAASQSALHHLVSHAQSCRLMIVVSYRPGQTFEFPGAFPQTAIRLRPLDDPETDKLIKGVTGATNLPPGLSALICQSADGNPLFVEEACYSLLESGAVSLDGDNLVMRQPLEQLLLPDTVQAIIRARLDRMDHGAREVAGLASIIGRVFDQRILKRMYRGSVPLDQALATLQAQEIIQQTKIAPQAEYSFRHVLTREVAYDTILHQQRKQLHETVGLSIEELHPERVEEHASILAYHYARSGRADRAVLYGLLAGDQAARLYANTEALTYFDEALAIARSVPTSAEAKRWQIDAILRRANVAMAVKDMERESSNLRQASVLAEELGDRPRLAQALYWVGRNHYVLAELEQAIEFAQRSLQIADDLGDATLAAPPVNLMGRAYWQLSDFIRSAQMSERSVEQMHMVGNRSEEATAAGFTSALFGYMGEFDKALAYSDRSIRLARELRNPYAEAASFHYRGIIHDQQGDWDSAIADYTTAQQIAEKAGDMFRVYIARFMEGRAHHMRGDLAKARASIEAGISLAAQLRTTFLLGQAKNCLAACRLSERDATEAVSLCQEAIGLAEKAGDKFTEALARRTLGEALGRTDPPTNGEAAMRAIREAIAIQEKIGARPELARSYAASATLLKTLDDVPGAAVWSARATMLFRELRMDRDLAQLARTN
jgi:class 3 adenylate cyclase/tetratricopeptide (TPR) repeat protein